MTTFGVIIEHMKTIMNNYGQLPFCDASYETMDNKLLYDFWKGGLKDLQLPCSGRDITLDYGFHFFTFIKL